MGIFDIFTGQPGIQAAQNTRNYLTGVQNTGNQTTDSALTNSQGFVNTGATGGLAALGQGYGTGVGAVNQSADAALGYLGSGTGGALDYLKQAGGAYAPLSGLAGKYGGATDLYLNSLGVNGAAGNDAAKAAFQAGPGYNFALDQGIDAINRRNNQAGLLNSGNADRDAQTYGIGLANQNYGNWQNQLAGFVNPELSATGTAAAGQSGALTNSANLANSQGLNQANVASQRGSMLANLAQQYGTGAAGINVGQGTSLAGLETGAANSKNQMATSLAGPYANTYNQEAQAQMAGSGNLWGLGLNLARLGVSAAGGGFGGFGGGTTSIPGAGTAGGLFGGGTLYTGDPTLPGFGAYRGA